ncbi:MAG TPA: ATP-dependent dethiobiotin synthetase BioD [Thermoleophilaceae bacterium]|nr:ATP-dependent dethiobiotin synthetase BioD [Thermoleophilaceae bacterium]
MRGLFVTGTDTGVGKTVVAAAICAALAARGERVAAFKPVVTGTEDDPGDWPPDHELLAASANAGQTPTDITPITFSPPVSPHYAAQLAQTTIDPAHLLTAANTAARLAKATTPAKPTGSTTPAESAAAGGWPSSDSQADRPSPRRRVPRQPGALICEGVGGLLVPLTLAYSVRDLAVDLALPLVIVARTGLGTINHTLLTVDAARGAGLHVAGIVLTPWPAYPEPIEQSNRATIERLSGVAVSGLPPTTPPTLAAAGGALPLDDWL